MFCNCTTTELYLQSFYFYWSRRSRYSGSHACQASQVPYHWAVAPRRILMGVGKMVGTVLQAQVLISFSPHGVNTGNLQFTNLIENHNKMWQGRSAPAELKWKSTPTLKISEPVRQLLWRGVTKMGFWRKNMAAGQFFQNSGQLKKNMCANTHNYTHPNLHNYKHTLKYTNALTQNGGGAG